jgi:hypothetical protein
MDYRDVRLPTLPQSYVERWHREQRQQGGKGILSGARGSLLGRSEPVSDEAERRRKFQIYWDYWKSPEYAAIHDAHRQEAIQRRRAYEEQEQEKLS